ncbi:phosphoribosylanthranilate isomerase [Lachnospiraceae bacterium]|nr:phosphoribosylanthranilate isomerase [Lachnospiraceae bacterium]
MMGTKIKICGLKRIEDIEMANALHPDYIGFVFADFSHRYVDKETAVTLKSRLDPEIQAVGVFVNEDVHFVAELMNEGVIDIAQLHGSEDNDYIAELRSLLKPADASIKIIRAFNINKISSISEIEESAADLVLVDSGTGSGDTFDWSKLDEIKRPYLLAGGLSPDNIREAVSALHPYGVDVSSGVETNKLKDPEKMRRFVELVRETESCTSLVDEEPGISYAKREDLEEILQLQYLAYQSEAALFKSRDIPPLKETLEEVIEEFEAGTVLKLVEDGKIIGSVRASEKDGTVYIGKLMVHPTRQRRGYGRHLLEEIEKCYPGKRYELFTSTRSIDNISLYQKCGYIIFKNKVISDELEFVYLEKGKVEKI